MRKGKELRIGQESLDNCRPSNRVLGHQSKRCVLLEIGWCIDADWSAKWVRLSLILIAFGAWVVVDVTRMLRANRFDPRLFWSTYVACLLPLLVAWVIFKNPYGQDIQIIFVMTAAHFIVVSLLVALINAAKLSIVNRVIVMLSVIIAAYIFAIILSPTTPF